MKKILSILFVSMIVLMGTVVVTISSIKTTRSSTLADSPWPCYKGDVRNTGLSPYDTSHVDGTIKWEYNIGKRSGSPKYSTGSPTIGNNGVIYRVNR